MTGVPALADDVLANVLAQALVELAARAAVGGRDLLARKGPLVERLRDDSAVQKAIGDAVEALSEVERIDPAIGGEALRDFLRSPEVEQILRQLYAWSWAGSPSMHHGDLATDFAAALARAVPAAANAPELASRLFAALVRATERTLAAATQDGVLAAHEAMAASRHHALQDEIATVRLAIEALDGVSSDRRAAALEFERALRHRIPIRHGHISPFDFDRERRVPLDELYVAPGLVRSASPLHGAAEGLSEFLTSAHREVLLGHPGVGKSTLLQKVAVDLARKYDSRLFAGRELTPFPVVLRDYAAAREQHGASIVRFMAEVGEREYSHPSCSSQEVEYLLLSGRLVVLFDGLDELIDTSYRRVVRDDIETFCASFPAVPVLVTSRKVGYDQAPLDPSRFRTTEIAQFDDDQVGDYTTRWFATNSPNRSDAERAEVVASLLDESRQITDLRSTPLMLALICSLYSGRPSLPRNRAAVYEACAELMFRKWDEHRRIRLGAPFEYHLRPCLDHLAAWVFGDSDREAGVTEDALVNAAAEYLQTEQYEDREAARAAARDFIEFCSGRPWVLTDTGTTADGERLYEFTHRTFLEFYAAEHVARHAESPEELAAVLAPRVRAAEWDIVAQLTIQLADRGRHGAAARVVTALLTGLPELEILERLNVESFLLRLLEIVVVQPSLVRQVTNATMEDILAWAQMPAGARRAIGDASRVMEEMMQLRSQPDVMPMIVEAIKVAYARSLQDAGYDQALATIQLGTLLPELAQRTQLQQQAGSDPDIEEWRGLSRTLLDESKERLEEIADLRFGAGLLAARSGLTSATHFVRRYRVGALFRGDPLSLLPGGEASSLAATLLLPGDATPQVAVTDSLAPLAELGELLPVAGVPWVVGRHEHRLGEAALRAAAELPEDQPTARLGGLLLLLPEAEADVSLRRALASLLEAEIARGVLNPAAERFVSAWLTGDIEVRGVWDEGQDPFADVG